MEENHMPKLTKGKPITITFSPYMLTRLERLAEQKQITKSAVITLALEHYAKNEDKKLEQLTL